MTSLGEMPKIALSGEVRGLTLRERQSLLVKCLEKLFAYAHQQGMELTLGEGYIQEGRKARDGRLFHDGVHMPGSLHYDRLAIDLNLFVRGEYISDGKDLAWIDLGAFWESLDPENCAWGGRFKSGDSNHFSIRWGGRA